MLRWLRRFLTDSEAVEQRITGELHAMEERLSRRILVAEQRLAENERVLRRLGHQVSRIEGRTSVLRLGTLGDVLDGAVPHRNGVRDQGGGETG